MHLTLLQKLSKVSISDLCTFGVTIRITSATTYRCAWP